MYKDLKKLQRGLSKLGQINAANEIGDLAEYLKSQRPQREPTDAWQKILDDYDKPAYRVEAFHTLAENIARTIISPLMSKKEAVEQYSGIKSDEQDKAEMIQRLAFKGDVSNIIKRAVEAETKAFTETSVSEPQVKGAPKMEPKPGGGFAPVPAERAVAKGGGLFSRAMPIIGLAISLPLFAKNLTESWHNGVALVSELPLDKYGINRASAVTPAGLPFAISSIINAIKEHKEDPTALYEILEIIKTIESFWMDLLFTVSNGIMVIIDAITVIAMVPAIAAWVDGPIFEGIIVAVRGTVGTLISLGLMGLEFGSEWISYKFWNNIKLKIKTIAENKINEIKTSRSRELRDWWRQIQQERATSPSSYSRKELEDWWAQQK